MPKRNTRSSTKSRKRVAKAQRKSEVIQAEQSSSNSELEEEPSLDQIEKPEVNGQEQEENNDKAAQKMQEALMLKLKYWSENGLKDEVLEDLLSSYPRPKEFEAPKLNPEIACLLSEADLQRDNMLMENQNLIGSALTALGSAYTMMKDKDENEAVDKMALVQKLSDAAKLITQYQHNLINQDL